MNLQQYIESLTNYLIDSQATISSYQNGGNNGPITNLEYQESVQLITSIEDRLSYRIDKNSVQILRSLLDYLPNPSLLKIRDIYLASLPQFSTRLKNEKDRTTYRNLADQLAIIKQLIKIIPTNLY